MDKSRIDHRDLLLKFTSMKSAIKKSLVDKRTSTADIIRVLNSLKAFHPSCSSQPLLNDCLNDLKKAKNVRSLLTSLPDENSVLQYHIYEALANELGTTKDKELVREYEVFLENYCQKELVKCPRFCDVHQAPVTMSISKDFKRQTLGQFLQSFHSRVCELLLLNNNTLCLCDVKTSTHRSSECVQVRYQVPHFVKEAIFPLNQECEDALRAVGVLELICEGYQMRNQSLSTNSQKSSSQSRSSNTNSCTTSSKHSTSSRQSHRQPPVTFSESLYPHRSLHNPHNPHTSPLAQSMSSPLNGTASMTSSSFPNMEMAHLSDGLVTSFATPTSLHGVGQNDVMMTSLEEAQAHFLANQLLAGASTSLPDQSQVEPGQKSSDTSDNDEKSSDQKPKPAPGKKTRGRVKIPMEYIKNKLRRYTTFSKRKSNIMKKAYELSTLTGTQVMLMVASETGHVYTFATPKLQPMITSEAGKALIQTCLHQPDPPQAPPTLPPEQFDVRMSSTGYEETELNNYQMTDDDKLDNPSTSTAMSLPNFPPGLGLSLPTDMSSLMPTLSSIQSLSGSTPSFLPPPLISPNLSPPDGEERGGLRDRDTPRDRGDRTTSK